MKNKIYSKLIILLALVLCLAACDGAVHLPEFNTTTYEITFDANGGSGNMGVQTVKANRSTALLANTFTRTGYTFDGWNTKADGTGTPYTNENLVTISEDLILYAIWKPNTYSITYVFSHNLDAGYKHWFDDYVSDNNITTDTKIWTSYKEYQDDSEYFTDTEYPITYVYGIGASLPYSNVNKDSIHIEDGSYNGRTFNFDFEGWYTDSSLESEYRIYEISPDYYGNITLYASFEEGVIGI